MQNFSLADLMSAHFCALEIEPAERPAATAGARVSWTRELR
jgi:hypothetical protein